MTNTEKLVAARREARTYIKDTLHNPPWNIPLDMPDAKLADVLGGTIGLADSLRRLKEGTHNPTKRLVTAFKNHVRGLIADNEIDSHLIDPFSGG